MSIKPLINIYASGGAGINIIRYFETYRNGQESWLANVNPVYIDTSRSNLEKSLPEEQIYTIEGLDGSGKVRKENAKVISDHVLSVLLAHPASSALNVIVSSGGGGSGSVIAPSLVSELLKRNLPVIVVLVGSTDSTIELLNTIRTIKSYEAVARLREVPVISMYFENSEKTARKRVDADVHHAIGLMCAVFSGTNKELDSSDLKNWLNYKNVTSYEPALAQLEFFADKFDLRKGEAPISIVTLAVEGEVTTPGVRVEYQTVGYMDKEVMITCSDKSPFHGVIIDGAFNAIHERLDSELSLQNAAKDARMSRKSILSDSDKPSNNGIVV